MIMTSHRNTLLYTRRGKFCCLLVSICCFRRTCAAFHSNRCSILEHPFSSRVAHSTFSLRAFSSNDEEYLNKAIECARLGCRHTFPNPAVGCVLVQEGVGIIGQGFHPRAGFPHAEIFALLQAGNHVKDGVAAAQSVVDFFSNGKDSDDFSMVRQLTDQYSSPDGPELLIGGLFAASKDRPVTAYVTLEPCCHQGKRTPPCANSLVLAQVDRVVVGLRDPNPRVDGGGVQVLLDAGIVVDLAADHNTELEAQCYSLVTNFCKRITPRDDQWPNYKYDEYVTGGMRRALRALAGRLKSESKLAQIEWGGGLIKDDAEDLDVELKPVWMEHLDGVLWEKELVQIRLNKAVEKKKDAKVLGEIIGQQLQAHVVQTLGHTCLLYRPAIPPVLDLNALVLATKASS